MNQRCLLRLVLSACVLRTSCGRVDDLADAINKIDVLNEKLPRLVLSPMLKKLNELDRKLEQIKVSTGACSQESQQTNAGAIRYLGQQILDLNLNFLNTTQQFMLKEDIIVRNLTKLALHQSLFFEALKPDFGPELISAVEKENVEHVVGLLELGAPIEFEDAKENRAIHKATGNSNTKILRILLDHGAMVNPYGEDGTTALQLASQNGCLECVRLLLAKGAEVNCQDRWDETPLIDSARNGHGDIVELLLENGADVNALQVSNLTALHLAAGEGHINIIKILIRYGADLSLKTVWKFTALDFAIKNEHYDVVNFLKNQTNKGWV